MSSKIAWLDTRPCLKTQKAKPGKSLSLLPFVFYKFAHDEENTTELLNADLVLI